MNTQLQHIDTNINRINDSINNIYYVLNIISNSILMNQTQSMLNDRLRRQQLRSYSTTPSALNINRLSEQILGNTGNTTNTGNNTNTDNTGNTGNIGNTTNTTNTTNTPNRNQEYLNNLLSTLFRGETPLGMEISVMGLNRTNDSEAESDTIVVSHHNIFNNTKIKKKVYEQEEGELDTCSICLGDIEHTQIIREINKCKHIFHVDCADRWFQDNINCPNCRQDIRIEIVD